MSVTVNKLDYIFKKLLHEARSKMNDTVEISDEEYENIFENNELIVDPSEEDDHDYSQDYLTFEALEDGTFSFTINDLYYSTNNGESWKSLAAGTETELITKGTKVLWKRELNLNYEKGSYGSATIHWTSIGTFSSTCKFNISGNILSLIYNTFYNEIELPILYREYGYQVGGMPYYLKANLFENCTNLISAQNLILPKKITKCCFGDMFNGCTSLIITPNLLYYNLDEWCYYRMFNNCTSLNYIKMLASDITANNCLTNWLNNVSSSGTFIKNSKATFNIGDSGIPAGWEVIDEEVPEE